MQQRLSMPMRRGSWFNGPGPNLMDGSSGPGVGWTQGATLIDPLPLSPPLAEAWKVLAWAFTFAGAWVPWNPNNHSPSFGKLGAVWAGILTGGEGPTGQQLGGFNWQSPMLPMPVDLSTFQKVWDGGSDPAFPAQPSTALTDNVPSVQATIGVSDNLAAPITVDPGRPLAFGVWLTPSLVQNTLLQVWNANVSVIYDDGKESPS
jgi:hypothetical protein